MGETVVLTTEGTYPFHRGGVSTWCQMLINGMPQTSFEVLALVSSPFLKIQYELPANVMKVHSVPMWGHEQPMEHNRGEAYSLLLRKHFDTTDHVVKRDFLPVLSEFLEHILHDDGDPLELGVILARMHSYFRSYDYRLTWFSAMTWGTISHQLREHWAREHPLKAEPSPSEIKQAFRLLYHLLVILDKRLLSPDIIHSSAAGFCGIPGILSKLAFGTPYLLTEHGVYIREQFLNLRRYVKSVFVRSFLYKLMMAIVRCNYAYADQTSPVCAYNARWERWLGADPEQIEVIFNGVDETKFCPQPRAPRSTPLVSTVGLIFPLKGQIDLIEAAGQLRQSLPDTEYRVYGSASDQEYYAECCARVSKLGLDGLFNFAGTTNSPWQVYSEADVVVFPSISEAFPYALIEAMLCGAAVVATDVGGVPEALGDAGLLVRPHAPNQLADALHFLLKDPTRRSRLGEAARVRALRYFKQSDFISGYAQSYCRLQSPSNLPELVAPAEMYS